MAEQWHARPSKAENPVVFFDIGVAGQNIGRLKMELFADIAPKTGDELRIHWSVLLFFIHINILLVMIDREDGEREGNK